MAKGTCGSCGKAVFLGQGSSANPVCQPCRRQRKGIAPDGRINGIKQPGVGSGRFVRDFGTSTCIGCGADFTKGHPAAKRCSKCSRQRNGGRGSARSRGYGPAHRRERKRWVPIVRAGLATCWRCGKPIAPDAEWDLGHDDNDRNTWRGPEHPACNRATYKRVSKPSRRLVL